MLSKPGAADTPNNRDDPHRGHAEGEKPGSGVSAAHDSICKASRAGEASPRWRGQGRGRLGGHATGELAGLVQTPCILARWGPHQAHLSCALASLKVTMRPPHRKRTGQGLRNRKRLARVPKVTGHEV